MVPVDFGFVPDSGGVKIPTPVKADVERRILQVGRDQFEGKYERLEIRFRSQFCYIDVFCEPNLPKSWPPKSWKVNRQEYIEKLRKTPIHLCRLRYFGQDQWGFGFFSYSNEKYQPSVYPDGNFLGKPEDAFVTAAEVHLLG